jgi:hypothetical protein
LLKKIVSGTLAGLLLSGAAVVGLAGAAGAAVTFDPSCPYQPSNATGACGFVGKGDVQSALGWNNDKLQKNANTLQFSYSQPADMALSRTGTESGTQDGTQSATQSTSQTASETASQDMTETLSCTVDTENHSFTRLGKREGSRDGSRTGSRSGSRTGSREGSRTGSRAGDQAGSISGNVSYGILFDARVKNQITGFLLKSATSSGFVATGQENWQDWQWGGWDWSDTWSMSDTWTWDETTTWNGWEWADWTWGATNWGQWDSAPGDNPNVCDSNNPHVTDYVHAETPGDISSNGSVENAVQYGDIVPAAVVEGAVTEGAIAPGAVVQGAVTYTGPARMYVNGVALG